MTKQGILSTTDGLALSGNTLSLDADILGLPNQVGDLSDALDDVAGDLANNYYTATEIDDLISGVSGGTTTYNGINEYILLSLSLFARKFIPNPSG